MIDVVEKPNKTIIRLEPNRSATWDQTRTAILSLSAFMLLIGIGWLVAGVWMILPFVFLDILVFSYFFIESVKKHTGGSLLLLNKKR